MSRVAIACALCLLLAGCTAPTAPTAPGPSATDAEEPATATALADDATTSADSTADSNDSADAGDDSTDAGDSNRSALDDAISVSGGEVPVDHDRVFARTTRLLGVNASPPSMLLVRSAAEIRSDTGGVTTPGGRSTRRNFVTVMGIGQDEREEDRNDADEEDGRDHKGDDGRDEDDDGDGEGGDRDGGENDGDDGEGEGDDAEEGVSVAAYAPSANSVVVNERMTVPEREVALERTLAHEFVHTVQFRQDAFERVQRALDLRRDYSRDRYLTFVSVVEGTAVFVAQSYDRRYLPGDSATVTTAEGYRSAPSGVKYSIARYYFGGRYLDSRFDSPANVSRLYDDPPRTTEQLLHPDANRSETPASLALSVFPGENRTRDRTNVNGELFTRIALGTQLNESRAAAAAEGWGADRLVPVTPTNRTRNRSFVWATRWDSPADADEFEGALSEYLESRAKRVGGDGAAGVWQDGSLTFRTVRLSEETVVLLAGEESFVRNATLSGTNSSVSVSAAE